jgi:hypothetical protein
MFDEQNNLLNKTSHNSGVVSRKREEERVEIGVPWEETHTFLLRRRPK